MSFQYKVRNLDGTLGEMKKFGVDETAEEKAKRLEKENQLLLDSIMEMSSHIANQEQRVAGQEKAIMEMSTFIASLPGGESDV